MVFANGMFVFGQVMENRKLIWVMFLEIGNVF